MASSERSDTDVVDEICALDWSSLSKDKLIDVAWAYFFFSIQFRENLKVARRLFPANANLEELDGGECDTSNLSPWEGVAAPGERMDHDEFMRRALSLTPLASKRRETLDSHGTAYLDSVRATDPAMRATSIVSYEAGGLEHVFRAMLTAPDWDDPLLRAFRHFLRRHIELDEEHGKLVRHLEAEQSAAPLWMLFKELLLNCVPVLAPGACQDDRDIRTRIFRVATAASDLLGARALPAEFSGRT